MRKILVSLAAAAVMATGVVSIAPAADARPLPADGILLPADRCPMVRLMLGYRLNDKCETVKIRHHRRHARNHR